MTRLGCSITNHWYWWYWVKQHVADALGIYMIEPAYVRVTFADRLPIIGRRRILGQLYRARLELSGMGNRLAVAQEAAEHWKSERK